MSAVIKKVEEDKFLEALLMSLALGDKEVMHKVFICVPPSSIPIIARHFPESKLGKLLDFIADAFS